MPKKEYDFSAFDELKNLEETPKVTDEKEIDFSAFDSNMEEENLTEEKGILEALARGGAQGLSLGFADEITGALEAGYETVFGKDKLEDLMENYSKYRDESRKEYEQAEKDQKAAYLTGEFGSGIGAALLTGGAAAPALARSAGVQALKSGATKAAAKSIAAKTLAKQSAKQGAGLGAAYSAGESEADLTQGEVGDFTKDVAIGAGMGAGMGYVTPAIGKGLEAGARVAGKGIKKASQYGLRKAADLESDIFQKILKDPKAVREAGEMTKSADDLIQQGNKVLNEASYLASQAKDKLDATEKYNKSFIESTFNKVLSTLNPADRQSKRQLLNLKDDILNIKLKNKQLLSDIDLQNVLDDVYELAYTGLKKDAADSTKKAIRQVGREISTTLKEENPIYKNLMKESEDRFKFVTDLSDMYGMNRAGIEVTEDVIDGSALKYTQTLDFPKRKTDTAIANLKKVIDPKKVDDKNFIENAVKKGFLNKDFAKSNEARAVKELLDKDPNLKVGDLMSARALIGGAVSGYMGGFIPYAFAVMSKPAARKLLTNMDKLGIKKGTEAADKYLEKLVTTGTLAAAMQDTKEVISNNATEKKNEIASNVSSMKEGDLMDLAESVKGVNSSLYNQLINISKKPINKRKTYVQMLVSDPSKRSILTKAINKQNEAQASEDMQGVQNEEDITNNTMPDTTSGNELKKKVENTREPSSLPEDIKIAEGDGDTTGAAPTGQFGITQTAIDALKNDENFKNDIKEEYDTLEEIDSLPKNERENQYNKLVNLYIDYLNNKMPDNMKSLPNSFKESLIDSAFNLGPSVFKYNTLNEKIKEANQKEKEEEKNKTLLEALRLGILDTANESGKSMRGLAKRRAKSYNRFAKSIDAKEITSIEQKEDGTIIYYDKDNNEIFKYQRPKHEQSKAIKESI